jgi:hypothetical protein
MKAADDSRVKSIKWYRITLVPKSTFFIKKNNKFIGLTYKSYLAPFKITLSNTLMQQIY